MVRNIISIGLFSFLLLLITSSASGPNLPRRNQVKKIVIDAGHGGHDPGTSGKFSREKDIKGMCHQFNRIAKKIIATQSRHPRSLNLSNEELKSNFPDIPYIKTRTVQEAVSLARADLSSDEILLISGSMYLVSEARKLCIN